ncbi:pyrimidine 5-nucleotidase [Meredithblackwellia eburnea MCA 4105]
MTATKKSSVKVTTTKGVPRGPAPSDGRAVVWFDMDNVLYSKECGIAELMKVKIQAYFRRLGLPEDEAKRLHHHYYTSYGLAVRGLVRHHDIDPLDYDAQCDAALPLDEVLKPNPALKALLQDIDRSKYKVWALTNAYVNHAVRVLKLVDLADQFEGVVSCDYGAGEFSCKPEPEFFNEAIIAGGQPDVSKQYFVDDSALNIKGSHALKWGHSVLFDELGNEAEKLGGLEKMESSDVKVSVVRDVLDLRSVWKEIFISK